VSKSATAYIFYGFTLPEGTMPPEDVVDWKEYFLTKKGLSYEKDPDTASHTHKECMCEVAYAGDSDSEDIVQIVTIKELPRAWEWDLTKLHRELASEERLPKWNNALREYCETMGFTYQKPSFLLGVLDI